MQIVMFAVGVHNLKFSDANARLKLHLIFTLSLLASRTGLCSEYNNGNI